MYSIGEFSKICGLTVKALRHYHERGLLIPGCVDPETGYRYYDRHNVDRARVITALRAFDFSLDEIHDILGRCNDESDLFGDLARRRQSIEAEIARYREIARSLDQILSRESEVQRTMQNASLEVQEKQLDPIRIAGVRMKGKYSDCGTGFSRLGRSLGRHIAGPAMCLYYDGEYREDDADFEACFPLRPGKPVQPKETDIVVHELPGGRCLSLLHHGPYEDLGQSYARLFDHLRQKGYTAQLPSREVYLKGPGMIFKGNPKKYLTEIQVLVDENGR